MGFFTKDIKTLDDLCRRSLSELYYAEKRMAKVLPAMIAKAGDPVLRRDLEAHLGASRRYLTRVEEVFRLNGEEPCAVECPAIDGILIEAEEIQSDIADGKVLDAAMAGAVQGVRTFVATRYATVASWLLETGRVDCARRLLRNADDQSRAGEVIARIAEERLNARAHGRPLMNLAS